MTTGKLFIYFNSIKVRLKQILNSICSVTFEFQFHKGTIKTAANLKLAQYQNEISIP